MINKKEVVFIVLFTFFLIFSLSFVYATDVSISSEPVVSTIINDHDKPVIFNIRVTNNGFAGAFEIYTFEKFRIVPTEFNVARDETAQINVEFYPIGSMKDNIGYVTIPYYIRDKADPNSAGEPGKVIAKLVSFDEAFSVGGENIILDSDKIRVYFYNREDVTYDNLDVTFSSAFFDETKRIINLKPYQRYELEIPINSDELKKLVAGDYGISAKVNLNGELESFLGNIKILEKTGLSVKEYSSGFIVNKKTIEKINEGNVPTVAEISMRKNIISRLFSTFSLEPNKVERNGFFVDYSWQKELNPTGKLNVTVTTNWFFPLLLLIAFMIILYLFNTYTKQNLVITKKVGFVKTKTNDFALKVSIHVKARKFVEKVNIYDSLPAIAKLYERFGEPPTKFNKETGKMQWEIQRMAEGEERVFSYIFYSKINVIGKFELPSATGLYEVQGKLHETKSNRAFFINASKNQNFSEN